jgi:hypothetical protein
MMSWLRIDDGFAEHPKIADLSDAAFRTHVSALCYSARNLTDGHLPGAVAKVVAHNRRRPIEDLVSAGIWTTNGKSGYVIHDYLDYNESAEAIKEKRRGAAERMRNKKGSS